MTAVWKSLAVALIGLAAIVWLGRREAGSSDFGAEMSVAEPGCGVRPPSRCMIDVHYRAADLVVVSDDFYF